MVLGIGEGSIDLTLDKQSYVAGETINGTIRLNLPKPIHSKGITAKFYAEIKSGKHRAVAYLTTVQVSGEKDYSQGGPLYQFSIKIPLEVIPPKPEPGILGAFVNILQHRHIFGWYVVATLEVPMGIDMDRKIQITVLDPDGKPI